MIGGFEQAGRNVQDGVSLVQTAEAGLGSIQNPNLSRMRDLIVQALNGTLTGADRARIQNELENVKASINDIANNTEFNTTKVLTVPTLDNSVPPKWNPGTADIVFIIDRTSSMGSKINEVKDNIDDFINKISDNGIDVNMGLITYGDVPDGESILKSSMTSDLATFKSYINNITLTGGGDTNESSLEGIADSSNGALSYTLRSDSAKQFILVTDAPTHDNKTDVDGGDGKSIFDIDDVASELKKKGIKLTVVSDLNSSIKNQLQRLSDPTNGDYLNINGDFKEQLNTFASKVLIDAGCENEFESDTMPTLKLQVGANTGQKFEVQLFDARTKNLGVDDVSVDTIEEGEKSLQEVDKAIKTVSTQRGKFGSYQNALEHIYNNVGNYGYNLTEADARISDVDMAKEVMKMAKSSILEESAQSMLKQADDMQKSVLNLMTKWQGSAE
ncbi:flagellin [Clostridium estertheticum]|uniref:flagellin n=1 Tax=Clostridium estertheticum TaxID=238834 RepID=UPI00217DBBEB|nr:flagellin [Clostridium estertheticum]